MISSVSKLTRPVERREISRSNSSRNNLDSRESILSLFELPNNNIRTSSSLSLESTHQPQGDSFTFLEASQSAWNNLLRGILLNYLESLSQGDLHAANSLRTKQNCYPEEMHTAIQQFINQTVKKDFKILFNNEFVREQLSHKPELQDYLVEAIRIQFGKTPFGQFTLHVNHDESYSYEIKLNENTLKDLLAKRNEDKNFSKLASNLNKIFGHDRDKQYDDINLTYKLKNNRLKFIGNETKEIELKVEINDYVFVKNILIPLFLAFASPLIACFLIPAFITVSTTGVILVGTITEMLAFLTYLAMYSYFFHERSMGKLKGTTQPFSQEEINNLAQICQEAINKPPLENYFSSENISSILDSLSDEEKRKHHQQLFSQWNNNVDTSMSNYFKIQEKTQAYRRPFPRSA